MYFIVLFPGEPAEEEEEDEEDADSDGDEDEVDVVDGQLARTDDRDDAVSRRLLGQAKRNALMERYIR